MNQFLRDRILRKLDTLSDERAYQVLDFVEFLESKYAERQNPIGERLPAIRGNGRGQAPRGPRLGGDDLRDDEPHEQSDGRAQRRRRRWQVCCE